MSRLKIALSIFAITAFIALGLGVSQAQAGLALCNTDNCCPSEDPSYNCTIVCSAEPGGLCTGDEGTSGADVFCGSKVADTINAGGGDDIICSGFGDDVVNGGYGADDIYSGWGEDTIYGEGGDDKILGGRCGDDIDGGDDADECYGGRGNEITKFDNCEIPAPSGDIGLEDGDVGGKCD